MLALHSLVERLRQVKNMHFVASSQAATGWSGVGEGEVEVIESTADVLLFIEKGRWRTETGADLRFNNTFRWTKIEGVLRLEHLRFGAENPVFLFDMALAEDGLWRAVEAHECRDDLYKASLHVQPQQIEVAWSINGPRKQESIRYIYRENAKD